MQVAQAALLDAERLLALSALDWLRVKKFCQRMF